MKEKFSKTINKYGESCRLIYKTGGEGESRCIKKLSGISTPVDGEGLFFLPVSEKRLEAGDKIIFRAKEYNILSPEGVGVSGEELYIRAYCGNEKAKGGEIIYDGSLKFKGVSIAYRADSLETLFAQRGAELLTSEGKSILHEPSKLPKIVKGSGSFSAEIAKAALAELRAVFSLADSGTLILPQIGGLKAYFTKLLLKNDEHGGVSFEFEFIEDCS